MLLQDVGERKRACRREILFSGRKGILREIVLSEAHAAEGIGDNIVCPLDIGKLRTELFNQKSLTHDTFSVELLEGEVLVIRKDLHLMSK